MHPFDHEDEYFADTKGTWQTVDKKTISFMGVDFHYQDRLNPFSIFQYVNEVKETIDLFPSLSSMSSISLSFKE